MTEKSGSQWQKSLWTGHSGMGRAQRRTQHRKGRELLDAEKKELRALRAHVRKLERENAYLVRLLVEAGIFGSKGDKEPEMPPAQKVKFIEDEPIPASEAVPGAMKCWDCEGQNVHFVFLGAHEWVICRDCHWRSRVEERDSKGD